jgi:hypothetical protein
MRGGGWSGAGMRSGGWSGGVRSANVSGGWSGRGFNRGFRTANVSGTWGGGWNRGWRGGRRGWGWGPGIVGGLALGAIATAPYWDTGYYGYDAYDCGPSVVSYGPWGATYVSDGCY